MQRFTNSIKRSLEAESWYSALFLSLALPDICGSLENPKLKVGDRYQSWFNRYMKEKYDPDSEYQEMLKESREGIKIPQIVLDYWKEHDSKPKCTFSAADCYRFRCRCLHQALPQKIDDEKIHFTTPDKSGCLVMHKNMFKNFYQLQIDIFCIDICDAVEKWAKDVASNKEIQERMKSLIEIYSYEDQKFPIVNFK